MLRASGRDKLAWRHTETNMMMGINGNLELIEEEGGISLGSLHRVGRI